MSVTMIHDKTVQMPVDAGILAGSEVLTMSGYKDVSTLQAGERIITRRGVRVLRAVTSRQETFRAVLIGPSTLGYSRPSEPMRVAPAQQVLVRDWRAQAMFGAASIVLPIERLIDDKHIKSDEEISDFTLYDLQFDAAEILYIDGVEMLCGAQELCTGPAAESIAA